MISAVAFGWATLTWWSWLLMALVVFSSTYGAYRLASWQENGRTGPCLEHLGTFERRRSRTDAWCFLPAGHRGVHRDHDGFAPAELAGLYAENIPAAPVQDTDTMRLSELLASPDNDPDFFPGNCTRSAYCYRPDGHDGECFELGRP